MKVREVMAAMMAFDPEMDVYTWQTTNGIPELVDAMDVYAYTDNRIVID